MNKDIKRFFIDEEMIGKEHECNCNGECGGDCKCHQEEVKIDVNDIVASGNLLFTSVDWSDPMKDIPIRYLDGAKELVINPKGNCIDVYAYEDMFIPYMGYAMINLGFAMQLPEGKIAKLYPRSSTFKTWGLIQTNHTGIIDNSYCGNNDIYMYPVQCTMAKQTEKVMINGHKVTISGTWVKKGDKICQMEICEVPPTIEFNKVDDLQTEDRGGFGTTSSR